MSDAATLPFLVRFSKSQPFSFSLLALSIPLVPGKLAAASSTGAVLTKALVTGHMHIRSAAPRKFGTMPQYTAQNGLLLETTVLQHASTLQGRRGVSHGCCHLASLVRVGVFL